MLKFAFSILSAAVVFGVGLAVAHLRRPDRPPSWPAGAVHGALGATGLGTLALALRGPPRGGATGTASFGLIAAVIAGGALLVGLIVLALVRRGGRGKGPAIAVHAFLAITAYVVLAAYVALG